MGIEGIAKGVDVRIDGLGRGIDRGSLIEDRDRKLDRFADMMERIGNAGDEPHQAVQGASDRFALKMDGRIHETMMVMEKADIRFKFMMSVKNKAIEAYREIMRMGA